MELFQTLGAKIEKLWRDENYDETVFPAIAADALDAADLPSKVAALEIVEWAFRQTILPEQRDVYGSFGDPPITLYNGLRFHIDIYFWLEGTTTVHQHNFCGAFQVLHGSSIHSHYEFEPTRKINFFIEIGEMNLRSVEYLTIGKIKQIRAGREYIHGLFHLDQPSATVVVRTYRSPLALPQFNYYKPALAIDPFFEEPQATKKMQCLKFFLRTQHPDTDRFIGEWLEEADFQTAFTILSNVRGALQINRMEQMFKQDATQNRFAALMEIVNRRHGSSAEILPKIFAHQEKVGEIVQRRSYVTDSEQRFFLALLMSVEGKAQILSLMKERFPEADPIEKTLDLTFDLANTRVLGVNTPNALGIADFGNLDLFVLENLLKDKSEAEIQTLLKDEHGAENLESLMQNLADKTERIKQSAIFDSLLQTSD